MPKTDIQINSTRIGTISLDAQDIYAHGGPEFPVLLIRIDFGISAYQQYGQPPIIKPLTCVSITGEFCSPPQRTVARFQHGESCYASRSDALVLSSQITFSIPIDLQVVERIEQARTGNLLAALKIRPLLAIHSPDGKAVETLCVASVAEIPVTIPKSEWVEKILPGLGYGGLELLEVRINDRAIAQQLPQSIEEIKQARQSLLNGDWEKAVQQCRNAIELIVLSKPLAIPATSKFKDKVDAFINDYLTASDEQGKLLSKQMVLIWEITSQAHHPSPTFKRPDAEFIVRATSALIGYWGRLL